MRPRFVDLDEATLRHLYIDERFTMLALATRLGCGATTISRRLRRFKIPARPRGPAPLRNTSGLAWSAPVAYAIGLIATDGNLSRDGRHISVVSKDLDLLETLRRCLGLQVSVAKFETKRGTVVGRVQWSDRAFYDALLVIGLTSAKSLTLGPLTIPDEYFPDFFRGCIDGDGSVLVYVDRHHTAKNERYVYMRLYVSLVSASQSFIDWMQANVRRLTGLNGAIEVRQSKVRRSLWLLRYAKRESFSLLRWMYYAPDVPSLGRKRAKAEQFILGMR
jgi:hypothetical protein